MSATTNGTPDPGEDRPLIRHLSYQQQESGASGTAGQADAKTSTDFDEANGWTQSWRRVAVVTSLVLVIVTALTTFWKRGAQLPTSASLPDSDKSTTKVPPPSSAVTLEDLRNVSMLEGLKNAAVAADHPVCSDVGLHILKDLEGNAVDAAVAVALCLGVANPASSGMGGGAFILIHQSKKEDPEQHMSNNTDPDPDSTIDYIDARSKEQEEQIAISDKHTEVIDCREIAPAAASKLMYKDKPQHASDRGGLSIGVPGELRGLELAHARHGQLEWSQVVEPAYRLAADGVPINANLAHEIGILATRYSMPSNSDFDFGLRKLLTHDDDWRHPLQTGDVIHNPALANTLKAVRDSGADALYKGPLAEALAKDIQDAGGIVTKEDIELYKATIRTPVVAHDIYGFSVVGVPPPSSGGAAIVGAARFLSDFTTPFAAFPETLSVHRMVEASKHVFAIRMSLSDPDYNSEIVSDAVRDLISGPYMKDLAEATRDDRSHGLSWYGGYKWAQLKDTDGQMNVTDADEGDRRVRRLQRKLARRFGNLNDGGTSHLSIVDKDGNAVSMTTSINNYFGSNVLSSATGIILSSTMDDFSTPGRPNYYGLHPSESNFVSPGKKPLSSMSPTMVFRRKETSKPNSLGKLILVLGASGGPKIISAVFQVMANVILRGMPLYEAMVHPRVHDQLIYHGAAVTTTENTVLEQGPAIRVSNRTRDALTSRGHRLLDVTYEGTVQAITVDLDTDERTAACDVRKGGSPAGY